MSRENEDLKKLRKLFGNKFAVSMGDLGLGHHAGGMYFEKTPWGRKGFVVLDNIRFGALQLSVNAVVTLTAVEEILFQYRSTVRGDMDLRKPGVQTISHNLGNLRGGTFRYWNVYNEDDVFDAHKSVLELIESYGLAFLKTVETPQKALDEMLLSTRQETVMGHPSRWIEKAMVLMLVLRRRDLFDEVSPVFDEIARNSSIVYQEFTRFRDWLTAHPGWFEDPGGLGGQS